MESVAFACRLAVALVFAFAVFNKVRSRGAYVEFIAFVAALRILPGTLHRFAAAATVAAEAGVVLALAMERTVFAGLTAAIGILMIFSAAVLYVSRTGRAVTCRCFGTSTTPMGTVHLVRNSLLMMGCLTALAFLAPVQQPAELLLAGAASLVAVPIIVRFEDLWALFAS